MNGSSDATRVAAVSGGLVVTLPFDYVQDGLTGATDAPGYSSRPCQPDPFAVGFQNGLLSIGQIHGA